MMMYLKLLSLVAMLIGVPALAADITIKEKLDRQLDLNGKRYGLVGQSVMILRNGEPIYEGEAGLANIEFKVPVEKGHLFPSYSVTKLFTSTLAMQLVEKGSLDISKSIRHYLPYLPEKWGKVTVEHTLTHTSGIPRYFGIALANNFLLNTKKEVFLSLENEQEHFPIGTQNRYNNTNFLLIAEILEKLTGKSYQQLVNENIVKPLGLNNTGHASAKSVMDNMVTSYQGRNGEIRRNIDVDWPVYTFAHSALYSTPQDLTKFMSGIVNGKLVKDAHALWNPMKLKNGRAGYYAFGFEYAEEDGYIHVGHDGGNRVKLRHYFSKDPSKATYTIAYQTNGYAYGVWTDVLANSLMSIIDPKQFSKASLNEAFMSAALSSDKKGFDPVYAMAIKYYNDDLAAIERFLTNLSYAVQYGAGNQASISAFEFTASKFPKSANTWDSIAGLWLAIGNKQKAIGYYKKALSVNPDWTNATRQIELLSSGK